MDSLVKINKLPLILALTVNSTTSTTASISLIMSFDSAGYGVSVDFEFLTVFLFIGAHYTCLCREKRCWLHCNDADVTDIFDLLAFLRTFCTIGRRPTSFLYGRAGRLLPVGALCPIIEDHFIVFAPDGGEVASRKPVSRRIL
jgi:hypothetical protein